jgi:dTDP-4-dehydrorhamnose reductase
MTGDRRGTTLVLGGSGFLGAHVLVRALAASRERAHVALGASNERVPAARDERALAAADEQALAARDERVVAACRSCPPGASGEPDVDASARVSWRALDALHAGAARALIDELEPVRVVVCTALSTIPECESYPGLARALNVDFPRDVARTSAAIGARLVLVSTDLVFGAEAPPPAGFDESARAAPLSHYGRTKAEGEAAVLDAHPGALVVRLPLLFGDSGGRALGASDRVVHAVERGEHPAMFTDEWRTPLDVACAASALVELAHGAIAGILHVAGPERVSRHELALRALVAAGASRAEALARIAGTTRREAGLESSRPEDVSLDGSRARSLLRTKLAGPSESLTRTAFEKRTEVRSVLSVRERIEDQR